MSNGVLVRNDLSKLHRYAVALLFSARVIENCMKPFGIASFDTKLDFQLVGFTSSAVIKVGIAKRKKQIEIRIDEHIIIRMFMVHYYFKLQSPFGINLKDLLLVLLLALGEGCGFFVVRHVELRR